MSERVRERWRERERETETERDRDRERQSRQSPLFVSILEKLIIKNNLSSKRNVDKLSKVIQTLMV